MGMMKVCTTCKIEKNISEFHKAKLGLYGVTAKCKQCRGEQARKWQTEHPDEFKRRYHERYKRIKETHIRWTREWKERNKETYLASCRDYYRDHKERYAAYYKTPKQKVNHAMRNGIGKSLRSGKGRISWQRMVLYSFDDLKKHLESKFKPGMSWTNYGQWHIDHIIPISAFNYQVYDDADFKRCWELKNLQPLWALENITKNDRLERPFQPCLSIGGIF